MPEGPELRLMADFLNQFANTECFDTTKSKVTKITTPDLKQKHTFVGAQSRGKELMLSFKNEQQVLKYFFSMGMSGNWMVADHVDPTPAHAHFGMHIFPQVVYMVDPRRFAKWKIADDWNINRSPDPLLEPNEWREYFQNKIRAKDGTTLKPKYAQRPIYELLMDQELFNGVGNYIRAEVLFKADINPNLTLDQLDLNVLHTNIINVMTEAYAVGGSQISAFNNPNNVDQPKNKGEWQQCYKKPYMSQKEDRHGRVFWYNPKWNL